MWDEYFKDATYPHDPHDHLVAADWHEERDDADKAKEHRELAEFWGWVVGLKLLPDVWMNHGGRVEWNSPDYGSGGEEEVGGSQVPWGVYGRLPDDRQGDSPDRYCGDLEGWSIMLYEDEPDAWNALLAAWREAKEAGGEDDAR
jgi:hypothetical protein